MIKKRSALCLAACLLLLPACQGQEAVQGFAPAPEQSVAAVESEPLPTDSAPLPTEGGKPDALPWNPPEEGEALPYEEYFSQTRTYELLDRRWALPIDGYRLHQEGSHLYMTDSHTRELLWEIVELDGMEVVSADERWVYLIVDGTELIRMDHLGENRETLFTDETGLISRMNQSDYDDPGKVHYDIVFDDGPPHPSANKRTLAVADRKVLYFWAGAEDGDGAAAYRLYLPEKRVDAVFQYSQEELDVYLLPDTGDGEGPFYRVGQLWPISNWEFGWCVGNPAFYELYSTLSDQDFPDYIPDDWIDRTDWCEREYRITSAFVHYQNALTGEHQEANSGVYSDLSWGEENERPAWWEQQ
ncbi:MAG: hypothetical protein HDT33_07750 [Clostridiales bacterium]|nr:hypothetical protein [Clostridiales bacterium]